MIFFLFRVCKRSQQSSHRFLTTIYISLLNIEPQYKDWLEYLFTCCNAISVTTCDKTRKMHITTRWDVVRKYRTTCFLVTTSFVASVISGAIYSRAKSPLAILVASMVGVIFTGSLLRHCVRHVVTWVQATHQDLHRAHLIAGAIDCLVG